MKISEMSRRLAGRALAILSVWLLLASFCFAQQRQGSSAIFLTGNVVMSGGAPLPRRVPLEMVCNGQRQPQGLTDRYGYFAFQIGINKDSTPYGVAERSTSEIVILGGPVARRQVVGAAERTLMGCGLLAVLEGYYSTLIELSGRRAADNSEAGTIVLTKLGPATPATVSVASLTVPARARKAFEEGARLAERNKMPEAEKKLEAAVRIYPTYEEAWRKLGQVKQALGQTEEARQCFDNADTVSVRAALQ